MEHSGAASTLMLACGLWLTGRALYSTACACGQLFQCTLAHARPLLLAAPCWALGEPISSLLICAADADADQGDRIATPLIT